MVVRGFANTSLCVKALKQFDKKVADAAEWLCQQPAATQRPAASTPQQQAPSQQQQSRPQQQQQQPAQPQAAKSPENARKQGLQKSKSKDVDLFALAADNQQQKPQQQPQQPNDLFDLFSAPAAQPAVQSFNQQQEPARQGANGAFGELKDVFSTGKFALESWKVIKY